KDDALLWRLGTKEDADRALGVPPLDKGGRLAEGERGDFADSEIPRRGSAPSAPFDKGVSATSSDEGTYLARARFRPHGIRFSDARLDELPGLTVHDLMLLPISRLRDLMAS